MSAPTDAKGNGWVPPWMVELGIQPNEAVTLSKLQLRSLMRPNKPLKVQVWACGILHTAGYAGQIAWTMRDGKKVPLRSADIARELHVEAKKYYSEAGIKDEGQFAKLKETKEHIRAALAALDGDGMSERQRDDGAPFNSLTTRQRQQLPNGRTRICFFVKPKPADPEQVRQEWSDAHPETGDPQNPPVAKSSLLPPSIPQILRLFQLEVPEKAKISSEVYQKAVARGYEEARKIFIETVEAVANESLLEVAPDSPPAVANGSSTLRNGSGNGNGKHPPSVGRSSSVPVESPAAPEPTDRPTGNSSENHFRPRLQKLIDGRVPGFALEEPELNEIAATIQTEEHFQQFEKAAGKQADPRGYRVYVTIARNCAKLHEKHAAAAAAAGTSQTQEETYAESRVRRLREERASNGSPRHG